MNISPQDKGEAVTNSQLLSFPSKTDVGVSPSLISSCFFDQWYIVASTFSNLSSGMCKYNLCSSANLKTLVVGTLKSMLFARGSREGSRVKERCTRLLIGRISCELDLDVTRQILRSSDRNEVNVSNKTTFVNCFCIFPLFSIISLYAAMRASLLRLSRDAKQAVTWSAIFHDVSRQIKIKPIEDIFYTGQECVAVN
ncbi:hypothetical protein RRG08_066839 [Elysia crispata]|uniref:Uncharacterized protein n=1 Tax=Elysia crispata TaxID=231223 RepID=A0AAE1CKG2_9GAST|nr:hypothetical protein RRG08_066839 [Elysia crispata]